MREGHRSFQFLREMHAKIEVMTSRPEIDIRKALELLSSRSLSLHDQSGQKKDIIDYVTSVAHSNPKMRRREDKILVIETLYGTASESTERAANA